jgi:hypothetical protein
LRFRNRIHLATASRTAAPPDQEGPTPLLLCNWREMRRGVSFTRHAGFVHLDKRAAGAGRGYHVSCDIENGRAQAARAQAIFFVMEGVPFAFGVFQVREQPAHGCHGSWRSLLQALPS